jgi:hypothetical protein
MHTSLPLRSLFHQRVAAPNTGAQVQEMRGRDPRLRKPADQQQLPQMPSVSPVSLRALLLAFPSARLGGLGQMRLGADPLELLHDEPPTGPRLQHDLEIGAIEPRQKPSDGYAVRRRDTRAIYLARARVKPPSRDLRAVLIHPHHQRHQITAPSRTLTS